ncbi:MAG TPA: 50S ribosomal protein L10 [Candidatus Paceibacterota bacterium]|jgi:large subunit ribosomal protein L10|nr:50S ribosomal protein L10 [Candidatus Paceibacterota bacterium]
MAKTKEQKQEVVAKLEGAMKGAVSTVFVHFNKVTVAEESAMRRDLRKDGVGYTVAKKTLIRRALEHLGYKSSDLPLEGEIAVAYGGESDATTPARTLHEFGKKLADRLSIVGGIFEGKLIGASEMREIATIPPVDMLRGMFANVINSPIAGLAIALKAVADKKLA